MRSISVPAWSHFPPAGGSAPTQPHGTAVLPADTAGRHKICARAGAPCLGQTSQGRGVSLPPVPKGISHLLPPSGQGKADPFAQPLWAVRAESQAPAGVTAPTPPAQGTAGTPSSAAALVLSEDQESAGTTRPPWRGRPAEMQTAWARPARTCRRGGGPEIAWDRNRVSRHDPWLLPPRVLGRSRAQPCQGSPAPALRPSCCHLPDPAGATGQPVPRCAALNVPAPACEWARTHSSTRGKGLGGWAGSEQTLGMGSGDQPRSSPLRRKPQECPSQACAGPRATSQPAAQLAGHPRALRGWSPGAPHAPLVLAPRC